MLRGPGLRTAPKLFLSAVLGVVWPRNVALSPTPSPIWEVCHCGIGNGCPRLDFSLAFFSHNKMVNWQKCSYITLGTLFSFFRHIIELPGLLSYQDPIHFVWWWNFNAKLSSFLLAIWHVHTYVICGIGCACTEVEKNCDIAANFMVYHSC